MKCEFVGGKCQLQIRTFSFFHEYWTKGKVSICEICYIYCKVKLV